MPGLTPTAPRQRLPSTLSSVSTPPPSSTEPSQSSHIIHLRLPSRSLTAFPKGYAGPALPEGTSWPPITIKLSRSNTSQSNTGVKVEPDESTPNGQADEQAQSLQESPGQNGQVAESKKRSSSVTDAAAAATADEAKAQKPTGTSSSSRKRARVGEGARSDGRANNGRAMGSTNAQAHKLGPKASAGAINERMRALDRSGRECRKWQRTGFKIKSFTGQVWELSTWRTPNTRNFGVNGSSDGAVNGTARSLEGSSVINGSDQSPEADGETELQSRLLESSPAPTPAAIAA